MRPSSLSFGGFGRVLTASLVLASAALLGACGGSDDGDDSAAKDCPTAATGTAATTLDFAASEYAFAPASATAKAGVVEITLTDDGKLPHTFVFDGCSDAPKLSVSGGGSDATELVELKPGTYTYFCDVPSHRGLGMKGTLTVS